MTATKYGRLEVGDARVVTAVAIDGEHRFYLRDFVDDTVKVLAGGVYWPLNDDGSVTVQREGDEK